MKPSRRIVEAIFFGAASLADAAERRAFLDTACGGDAPLRATVEDMLASQNSAERFFAQAGSDIGAAAASGETAAPMPAGGENPLPDFDERLGERIGRYKLLKKIGEGGGGAVYLAEQEEPVHRRVALKIIKLGMDTRSVIARFEAERQALALMDHPHIARVLDAGATARGRPFFVMELVSGTRITEFCDANKLDMRRRLELFIQVCYAVQHAHQKGIIHRDLKPSNILVATHDGMPAPKVIDFGIAKAIEDKLPGQTLFTAGEQIIGTPAYMSPEQTEPGAADVDTRSDIYSLGVLLYELLTGRTPFEGKELTRSGAAEMRRTLTEKEPQRPSAVFTTMDSAETAAVAKSRGAQAVWLASQFEGDLDWIVMKALEKDRTRRYETANGLASDVARYLNNEPVVARPPSRWYRFRKLVRRNKVVFAAGSVVVLALVAGLGASTWMFFKARAAEQQQARLRQVAEEARAKETHLRVQAEAREKLTEAVILVGLGKHEEAARKLEEMGVPPSRPTLDGVSALRSVGAWLATQGRWREASARFLMLLKIDELDDWGAVTWDYQCCGAVLAETGDVEAYNRFRRAALEKFSSATNGIAAGRVLNVCLLLPADPGTLLQYGRLGECVENWTATLGANDFSGWSAIPISLWNYRQGRFGAALDFSRRGLSPDGKRMAHDAALHSLAAMSLEKMGRHDEAQAALAPATQLMEGSFQRGLERGNHTGGYWHDWVFARVLLREASSLVAPATRSPL